MFLQPYILYVIFSGIDYLLTSSLVNQYGIQAEANPFLLWLMQHTNDATPILITKIAGALILGLCCVYSYYNNKKATSVFKLVWFGAVAQGLVVIWGALVTLST